MKRAILAAVVSIALVLAGAVALPTTDHAQAGLGGAAGNAGDANCDLEVDATHRRAAYPAVLGGLH
jgi:hypothetical protein